MINMNDEQLHTLADLQAFLTGTVAIDFTVTAEQRYEFIARTVRRFGYAQLKRADKAVESGCLKLLKAHPFRLKPRLECTHPNLWLVPLWERTGTPAIAKPHNAGIPKSGNQQARFLAHGKIGFQLSQHSRQNNGLQIWHGMCFQFGGAGNDH